MSFRFIILCLLGAAAVLYVATPLHEDEQGRGNNLRSHLRAEVSSALERISFEVRDVWRASTAKPAPKPKPVSIRPKLAKVKWRRAKPNLKAEYYIFLHSSSWCGPCRELMPYFASRYREMKKDGRVELLMISYDKHQQHEDAYLDAHNAEFPVAHCTDPAVAELPGIGLHCGTPTVAIMRASGEKLMSGHGVAIVEWRKYTLDFGKEKPKKRRRWWYVMPQK